MHELGAVAVAKMLWRYGREVHEAGPATAPHGHRWYGDRNGLRVAWGVTFGDPMPLRPTMELDFDDRTFQLFVKEGASTLDDVLANVRMVCLVPGNQAAVRAIDLQAVRGAMGRAGDSILEQALSALGVAIERKAASAVGELLSAARRELTRR